MKSIVFIFRTMLKKSDVAARCERRPRILHGNIAATCVFSARFRLRSAGFQPAVSPISNRQNVANASGATCPQRLRVGNPRYSRQEVCGTLNTSAVTDRRCNFKRALRRAFSLLLTTFTTSAVLLSPVRNRGDGESLGAVTQQMKPWTALQAERAGRDLAGGKCTGKGPGLLTASPMRPEDFSIIVPYGLVVGGHVTPIDHQYFAPRDFRSARDAYPVYAMADSRLVDIQPRTNERGTEYRMVFSMTCTFLYYYDLLTSLAPDIKAIYDKSDRGHLDIRIKAGQLVGRIGGQTLDFAVWNTEKPLSGFILPDHYRAESWKIFTADPLDYCAPDLKALLLSRYVRTAEPLSGKIDHDVDGRLIGNWFLEATKGYGGVRGEGNWDYWIGHLSFAPEVYDPTAFIVSIGDFGGKAQQFAVEGNAPQPEDVSVATGLVKYDLVQWSYVKADGSFWDRNSVTKGIKLVPQNRILGCVLVQLIAERKLKMECFLGKTSAEISAFTTAARSYTR